MKPYALALVVGKFAPLHRGHEALIAHARGLSRSLLLLSYAQPEPASCPAPLRERWLQQCSAQALCVVLDDTRLRQRCDARGLRLNPMPPDTASGPDHWRWLAWCLNDLLGAPIDAMVGSEAYVTPCAAHLSQALGRPVAAELFDPARTQVPISASAIRASPAEMSRWLAPAVAESWSPTAGLRRPPP